MLSEDAVKLALRPVCRLDCGISGVDEGAGDLLQPIAIDRGIGSQMLREDTLMKLGTLRQHGVGKGDAETTALVAKQIREAAGLIILLKRKIGIGNLGNRNDQEPQPKSLQHARACKGPVVPLQREMTQVPDCNP